MKQTMVYLRTKSVRFLDRYVPTGPGWLISPPTGITNPLGRGRGNKTNTTTGFRGICCDHWGRLVRKEIPNETNTGGFEIGKVLGLVRPK